MYFSVGFVDFYVAQVGQGTGYTKHAENASVNLDLKINTVGVECALFVTFVDRTIINHCFSS